MDRLALALPLAVGFALVGSGCGSDCEPKALVSDYTEGFSILAVDDTHIYSSSSFDDPDVDVHRVMKSGGAVETVTGAGGVFAIGDKWLYVATSSYQGMTTTLSKVPKTGGTAQMVAQVNGFSGAFGRSPTTSADGRWVAWTSLVDASSNVMRFDVVEFDTETDTTTVLATAHGEAKTLGTDAANVYFYSLDTAGDMVAVPHGGGSETRSALPIRSGFAPAQLREGFFYALARADSNPPSVESVRFEVGSSELEVLGAPIEVDLPLEWAMHGEDVYVRDDDGADSTLVQAPLSGGVVHTVAGSFGWMSNLVSRPEGVYYAAADHGEEPPEPCGECGEPLGRVGIYRVSPDCRD